MDSADVSHRCAYRLDTLRAMLNQAIKVEDNDYKYSWQSVSYFPVWPFYHHPLSSLEQAECDHYSYMPCLAVNLTNHFSMRITQQSYVGQTEFISLLSYQTGQQMQPAFVSLTDFVKALLNIHRHKNIAERLLHYDTAETDGYYAVTLLQGGGSIGVYRLYAKALDAVLNKHSYRYYHERFTSLAECNLAEDELVTACDTAKNRNIFAYLAYQRLKQQYNDPHLNSGDIVSTVTSHKCLLQSADMSQMTVDYGLEGALMSATAALYSAAKTPGYRAQVSLKAEGRMFKQVTWPIVSADYTHVLATGKNFNRFGQRVKQHNAESQGIVCVAYAMAKSQRCFYYFNQDQLDEIQSEGWRYRQQVQELLAAQQSVSQQQGQTVTAIAYAKAKFNTFLGQEKINR
ncbi:hypothetical protein PsalMR5_03029 [Piscirickettsia salmonis]|nr:hypothetical protein PsalSR1_03025 [Piscirickettsia salmonis]QGP58575.1 hypothetical protein PsalBI1_01147 [Piscirickettsia salmonis]QGP65141.1 hypothetical protein PsalMR5_03029 [Piscirickettsia salmonis]